MSNSAKVSYLASVYLGITLLFIISIFGIAKATNLDRNIHDHQTPITISSSHEEIGTPVIKFVDNSFEILAKKGDVIELRNQGTSCEQFNTLKFTVVNNVFHGKIFIEDLKLKDIRDIKPDKSLLLNGLCKVVIENISLGSVENITMTLKFTEKQLATDNHNEQSIYILAYRNNVDSSVVRGERLKDTAIQIDQLKYDIYKVNLDTIPMWIGAGDSSLIEVASQIAAKSK
jgi:hypothetical protein